jgi:hypothetical protein
MRYKGQVTPHQVDRDYRSLSLAMSALPAA